MLAPIQCRNSNSTTGVSSVASTTKTDCHGRARSCAEGSKREQVEHGGRHEHDHDAREIAPAARARLADQYNRGTDRKENSSDGTQEIRDLAARALHTQNYEVFSGRLRATERSLALAASRELEAVLAVPATMTTAPVTSNSAMEELSMQLMWVLGWFSFDIGHGAGPRRRGTRGTYDYDSRARYNSVAHDKRAFACDQSGGRRDSVIPWEMDRRCFPAPSVRRPHTRPPVP